LVFVNLHADFPSDAMDMDLIKLCLVFFLIKVLGY